MEVKYKYMCKGCNKEFLLERPVEEYMLRAHESCPNHDLVLINEVDELPLCSSCDEKMDEGFVFHGGEEYYCTKECLQTKYTMKQYNDAFHDGQAYWTAWY